MGDVPGLRIVIVRDSQLSACYTLFIMDSPAMETVAPVPTANDDATQQSVQRIREASEKRDRQLKELKLQFEKRTGRSYETWTTAPYVGNPDPMLVTQSKTTAGRWTTSTNTCCGLRYQEAIPTRFLSQA